MADFAAIAASPSFNKTVQALIGESTTPIITVRSMHQILASFGAHSDGMDSMHERLQGALSLPLLQALNTYFVLAEGNFFHIC